MIFLIKDCASCKVAKNAGICRANREIISCLLFFFIEIQYLTHKPQENLLPMKNLFVSAAVAVIAVSAALVFVHSIGSGAPDNELFEANVEALLNQELDPAVIICDGAVCGSCYEEYKVWPFYKCGWTGHQDDYCDCDKVGYL